MDIQVEWDETKARSNWRKHGVSFTHAAQVFSDPLALTLLDKNHGDQEERWITLGQVQGRRLVVVIHTWMEVLNDKVMVRIISAREATAHECRQYEG